jgi:hypothetical protein
MPANADVEAPVGISQANPGDLAAISRIMVYVDQAALLLSTAFAVAEVQDFTPARRRQAIRPSDDATRWYADLTNDVLSRLSQVRHAVAHGWAPSPEADPLAAEAVSLLAELTPVPSRIVALYRGNRTEGLAELARHLEIVDRQYAMAASLIGRRDTAEGEAASEAAAGFAAAREALLAAAGGAISLTEAAQGLGVTRQNLHKRIHTGSALGMMLDNRIILPRLQFLDGHDTTTIVKGLERVVRPFLGAKAGAWSALQFLIDPDPNLGRPPIEALRRGDIAGAEHAARTYLGLDEG